ncbi:MAG: hypothetical protein ACT6RE_08720 [Flavobacteriales bacterium]
MPMKLLIALPAFCISVCTAFAQTLLSEKVTADAHASFEPRALALHNSGDVYVTGRYETSVGYYTKRNGVTVVADTTLPHGTRMFLMRFDSTGQMLQRIYMPALEGLDIRITHGGNILACGFLNRYREENYEGDRTQGVFAALLNPQLELIWKQIYPLQYNSVPQKIVEGNDGHILILANAQVKATPNSFGQNDIIASRCILTDAGGKLLKDTLMYAPLYRTPNTLYPYDACVSDSGFLILGHYQYPGASEVLLLSDLEPELKARRGANIVYYKENGYERQHVIAGHMCINRGRIFVAGLSQFAEQKFFVRALNPQKLDSVFTQRMPGKMLEMPVICAQPNGGAVVFSRNDQKKPLLYFINTEGKMHTLTLTNSQYNIKEPQAALVRGNMLYILAEIRKGEEDGVYLARVRLK